MSVPAMTGVEASAARRPTALTVHLFSAEGLYLGWVVRQNLRVLYRATRRPPVVYVGRRREECHLRRGYQGWCLCLPPGARPPTDMHPATGALAAGTAPPPHPA